MSYQNIFKRTEKKYIITIEEKEQIIEAISEHMREDEYGKSIIFSLYFDTPDKILIRRSMDKPNYKEKLRVRSYGIADSNSTVFVEIKKKHKSVVYKRRISMTEEDAMSFLTERKTPKNNTQITHEIDYFFNIYKDLAPSMLLSYEREAFYDKSDRNFRVSFDENALWRDCDLSLSMGVYGTPILNDDEVIMEIKTALSMPLWMVKILSDMKLYPVSCSKYGRAYAMQSKIQHSINNGTQDVPNVIGINNYVLGGIKNA